MKTPSTTPDSTPAPATVPALHHLRFHLPHAHLSRAFGNDWFALKAEAFARFFGTPIFLVAQGGAAAPPKTGPPKSGVSR